MALEDPYMARDISVNSLGRVVLCTSLDQEVERASLKWFRVAVGAKIPIQQLKVFLQVYLDSATEEVINYQRSTANSRTYGWRDTLKSMQLVSGTMTSPGVINAVVQVTTASGDVSQVSVTT